MWARMFAISAGVTMNILLAVLIFWGLNYVSGKYLRQMTEVGYVVHGSVADRMGIEPGDRIISVNGKPVSPWDEIVYLTYIENLGSDITPFLPFLVADQSTPTPQPLT